MELKGKLSNQGTVLAARAPDRNIGFASYPPTEVQFANVLQDFFDDRVTDEFDFFFRIFPYPRQNG